jgi:mannose-6-phosphate isomerase
LPGFFFCKLAGKAGTCQRISEKHIYSKKTVFVSHHRVFPLEGAIQHYDWGGDHFLPDLLGISNEARQPFAELWLGTHHRAPSMVRRNTHLVPLGDLLENYPSWLGEQVEKDFGGRLPYLLKVLDVRQMLSIQAHPNKAQAEAGFRRENERGVPLEAPQRNFKDDNHKPEVMVALTDFWLLHGFRSVEQLVRVLKAVPELRPLQQWFENRSIYELYRRIMELPQAEVDRLLAPLASRLAEDETLVKDQPEYWAHRAFEQYQRVDGSYDRGIFSIFFLNLVKVSPGQGIYQGAGLPHAYLEGVNVELMANSDNVFRGGLTAKHIDVPVLLEHLDFRPVDPVILHGERVSSAEWAYRTPARDFQLNKIVLSAGEFYQAQIPQGPEVLILIEGAASVVGGADFQRGQAFFVPAGEAYALRGEAGSLIFKALVPTAQ